MTRLPSGGLVDRGAPLRFTLDGEELTGFRGDTLASALVALGRIEVAPSLYRGRPRGIVAADVSEPNAVVQVEAPYREPMLPATVVELVDGLVARTLRGVGRLPNEPETATYDRRHVHCDVLVVGAGPAGLAAALAASSGGARVLVLDDGPELGGDLRGEPWAGRAAAVLEGRPEVRVLSRTSAVGLYDGNLVLAIERRSDHLDAPPERLSRQRTWHVRARRVVLATGARERPLVFAGNDRPGVMLASAARRYVTRYAAVPGRRVVVATTNDSAYAAALDLHVAGVRVAALVDSRVEPPADLVARLAEAGIEVLAGACVAATAGAGDAAGGTPSDAAGGRVAGVEVVRAEDGAAVRTLEADLLAVSGGWDPDLHLFSQARGRTRWDDGLAAFVPSEAGIRVRCAGAANGSFETAECLADGVTAGLEAAAATGWAGEPPELPGVAFPRVRTPDAPVWLPPAGDPDEQFVDLQRDATVAGVHRALGAGMRSVEHVKRYTTIGTGLDQGRTSGVNVAGVVATWLGAASPGEIGTTTFRPPTVPVQFAALAGRDVGRLSDPARTTPIHDWHVAAGAVFEDVGQWKRPHHYPRPGEDEPAAVLRECAAARTGVAMMDATTLGKIELAGADAGEFLNRMYTNAFRLLKVGAARYGVMCTTDGMVFDDGVTMRLAEDRFLMSTTTGGAARVLDWLEEWLQTEWPELDVRLTSVTEQWATVAVVGPGSRAVVGRLVPGLDVSNDAFPFMTFRDAVLHNGIPARVARISFSGELAYEVNVASWYGLATWEAILEAGAADGITPYGTETMHVLRAEKGFPIVGQDTDGTVTPIDLGMDWVVSKKKDFVGKRSLRRPDTARPDRKHLVGLLPTDPADLLPEGAQLIAEGTPVTPDLGPVPMIGHVTSSYRSAALGRTFALALVTAGRDRIGDTVLAPLPDRTVPAVITSPVLYDPENTRRDG